MQTTLLGLAIAFILALVAALVGPYFIDWNQFRPQFEAEASRIMGTPVRVEGPLDARLLPVPTLRLQSVTLGGANDAGRIRAEKLDVEFSLGSLMRGQWKADQLTVNGFALDLGLDSKGRVEWPVASTRFDLAQVAIDRLNLTGRIALHDAGSRSTLELDDIAFSGEVRSLAGAIRGDGNFTVGDTRYPFRVSSGPAAAGAGTRLHLTLGSDEDDSSADLEGVLTFAQRVPSFEGALMLGRTAASGNGGEVGAQKPGARKPWRLSAKVTASPSAARLDKVELSYGAEDKALKFAGAADVRFGPSPLAHGVLAARQLDADRLLSGPDVAGDPQRWLADVRSLVGGLPHAPLPMQIDLAAEQIMLGGRPVQSVEVGLRSEATAWSIDRLALRAPGATQVDFRGRVTASDRHAIDGVLGLQSDDPDALITWLRGDGNAVWHPQQPFSLQGKLSIASDRLALDQMRTSFDGGTVEGRIALIKTADAAPRVEADLKSPRLDLDVTMAFLHALTGSARWPQQGTATIDVAHALLAGQDLHPFIVSAAFGPKQISLSKLQIGDAGSVAVEGTGSFDREAASGQLGLNATAQSLDRLTKLIAPLAPRVATRLDALGNPQAGPARVRLSLDVAKDPANASRASGHAALEIDAPQLKGTITAAIAAPAAVLGGIGPNTFAEKDLREKQLGGSRFSIETVLSSPQAPALFGLLDLDQIVAADGPAQLDGAISGIWGKPADIKAKLSAAAFQLDANGTVEGSLTSPRFASGIVVRHGDFTPLFRTASMDAAIRDVGLSSRVNYADDKLSFDHLDCTIAGARLRGHGSVTLDDDRTVDGQLGLDRIDIAQALGVAVGAGGDATGPLRAGLIGNWRGRVVFQALSGLLPGGSELQSFGGVVRSDGQSLTIDNLSGKIGGGDARGVVEARQTPNGLAVNVQAQLTGVDGAALRYRGLTMPPGSTDLQLTLTSTGRSASALAGAFSGSGSVTIRNARIAGLNPRAFDMAVAASDEGRIKNDAALRQLVEPALAAGPLQVKSAQIPFSVGDSRLRVGATTLEGEGAKAVLSGGYDAAAGQGDLRVSLISAIAGATDDHPEVRLFAAGPPGNMMKTIDLTGLSSWLALRTIDRETRRLDAIERRGAHVPSGPASAPENPAPQNPASGNPRPPPSPQASNAVTPQPVTPPQPVAPPLPPPVEIRPAPGPPARPKLRQPMVLTPSISNPARATP